MAPTALLAGWIVSAVFGCLVMAYLRGRHGWTDDDSVYIAVILWPVIIGLAVPIVLVWSPFGFAHWLGARSAERRVQLQSKG